MSSGGQCLACAKSFYEYCSLGAIGSASCFHVLTKDNGEFYKLDMNFLVQWFATIPAAQQSMELYYSFKFM